MKKILALVLLFLSLPAFAAGGRTIVTQHSLVACGAGADHTSTTSADSCAAGAKIDLGLQTFGSAQVVWSGLTGTVNGTVQLNVSNDGTDWDSKSGASVTLSGASGHATISLNGVASEEFYQVVYSHTGVTGGTVDVYFVGK